MLNSQYDQARVVQSNFSSHFLNTLFAAFSPIHQSPWLGRTPSCFSFSLVTSIRAVFYRYIYRLFWPHCWASPPNILSDRQADRHLSPLHKVSLSSLTIGNPGHIIPDRSLWDLKMFFARAFRIAIRIFFFAGVDDLGVQKIQAIRNMNI